MEGLLQWIEGVIAYIDVLVSGEPLQMGKWKTLKCGNRSTETEVRRRKYGNGSTETEVRN